MWWRLERVTPVPRVGEDGDRERGMDWATVQGGERKRDWGGRETVAVCRRRERRRQLSNPIFFPQISSTTHKKSQRSSKNKSGSDPSDSRLKIRFSEKYIKFQWSSKSVPNLVWWRERPVPGIREGGNTEREAHGFRRSQEWATVHGGESERNCWVRELRDRMGFRAAWNGLDWRLSESWDTDWGFRDFDFYGERGREKELRRVSWDRESKREKEFSFLKVLRVQAER